MPAGAKLAWDRYVWFALCACLALLEALSGSRVWTGDEPRYTYQAVGLIADRRLYPTLAHWQAFLAASGLHAPYLGALAHPYQTLSTAVIFGPLLTAFGLQAARWFCFAIGCAGLLVVTATLAAREGGNGRRALLARAGAVAAIAFSPPFLAYLRLIYPEILLFFAVAVGAYGLVKGRAWIGVAAATALPFLHVRALPLAVVLACVLVLDQAQRGAPRLLLYRMAGVMLAALGVFAIFQFALSGSLAGFAFPEYQPNLSIALDRVAMQIFGVRHGLLVSSPLAFLGIVGLVAGAIKRSRVHAYALALAATYVLTFSWSEAGESWSGRFWIAILPLIALGIDAVFASTKSAVLWFAYGALAVLQSFGVACFVVHPDWFLENRAVSIAFAQLGYVTPFQFNLLLPADGYPDLALIPPDTGPDRIDLLWFAGAVAAFVGALLATGGWRRFASACVLLSLALPIVAALATPLPRDAYAIRTARHAGAPLVVSFAAPQRVAALAFDDRMTQEWQVGEEPRFFHIVCEDAAGTIASFTTPSRPFVSLSRCAGALRIRMSPIPRERGFALLGQPGTISLFARP